MRRASTGTPRAIASRIALDAPSASEQLTRPRHVGRRSTSVKSVGEMGGTSETPSQSRTQSATVAANEPDVGTSGRATPKTSKRGLVASPCRWYQDEKADSRKSGSLTARRPVGKARNGWFVARSGRLRAQAAASTETGNDRSATSRSGTAGGMTCSRGTTCGAHAVIRLAMWWVKATTAWKMSSLATSCARAASSSSASETSVPPSTNTRTVPGAATRWQPRPSVRHLVPLIACRATNTTVDCHLPSFSPLNVPEVHSLSRVRWSRRMQGTSAPAPSATWLSGAPCW
mmetsp:Transcript_8027/g.25667  ORF Transcript_8027/g.25667 Transcript_8027/m.25667 type:complete len:288 (+) Transcript_8027:310-1173(+)